MDPAPEIPGGAAPDEAVSGSRTPESENIVNPERAKVIGALDEAMRLMGEAGDNGKLDDEQKRKLEDATYAKSRTLDAGKTYFSHEPVTSETTGKKYRYQERIPTDGILTFLDTKIREESTKTPAKRNADLLAQYRSIAQTLAENSRSVAASQRDPDRLVERVRLEAQLISRSDRDTGDPVKNWTLAEKAISTRLHLVIPRETTPIKEPAIPGPGEPEFIGPVMPDRVSAPGDPDFIGPVLPPGPGEEGFIGPVLPPGPGEPGFIGPVMPDRVPAPGDPDFIGPVLPPGPGEVGFIGPVMPESSASEPEEEDDDATPSVEDIRLKRFLIQLGAQGASAHKIVENVVRKEITNREAILDKDGKPLDLGKNAVVRAWNVLKYRMSRRGLQQGRDGLMREKVRYDLGKDALQNLEEANLGRGIAGNAATHLKELRDNGKEMLDRTRLYAETGEAPIEGEELSGAIEGPFRNFVTDTLLYGDSGILQKIRAGADESAIQAEIQEKMFDYVSTHQDDDTIKHFFGQNDSRYGEVSKFYATDLLETAKAINEQARIHAVAAEMLKDQIDIRLVRAQQEKASEIDLTRFEKLMKLSQKNRLASLVLTPTRAGVIAALGTMATQSAVRRTAMIGAGAVLSPWAVPVAGIAVGVAFAVGRERQRYKADTLDVARDSAEGQVAPKEAVYRKKIENVVHPLMVDINILRNGDPVGESGDKLTGDRRRSIEELLELPTSCADDAPLEERVQVEKNRQEVASRYGEIRARLSAPAVAPHSSVFAEIDRIQYTNGQKPEAGRTLLVQDLIRLREAATRGLSGEGLDEMNEFLTSKTAEWSTQLMTDKDTQEHEFKRARLKRALGQGAKMGVTAGIGGLLGQEVFAMAGRIAPDLLNKAYDGAQLVAPNIPDMHVDNVPGMNTGQTKIEDALGINETTGDAATPSTRTTESSSVSTGRNTENNVRNSFRMDSGSVVDETQQQDRITNAEDFVNTTERVAGKVVDTLENAAESIKNTGEDLLESAKDKSGDLADRVGNTTERASNTLSSSTDSIKDEAADTITNASNKAEDIVNSTIGDTRELSGDKLDSAQREINTAKRVGEFAADSARDELSDQVDSLENSVRDIAGSVKDKTLDSVDSVSNSANNVSDEIQDKGEVVVDSIKREAGAVQESGENIADEGQQTIQDAAETTSDITGDTVDATKDFTRNAVDKVTDAASALKDKVGDVFETDESSGKIKTVNEKTTETMRYWKPLNAEESSIPDIEKFRDLGENGTGTIQLNEQYTLSYDAQNGTSIINTETNTPVFSSENIKITPEGKVQIVGELPDNAEKIFEDLNFKVTDIDAANSPIEHTVFGPDVKMVEVAMGTGPDAPLTQIPEGTVWIDGKDGAHTLIVADRPDIVLVADAKFVEGDFTYDKEYSYPGYDPRIGERTDGLFSQVTIENTSSEDVTTYESRPVLGEHGELESARRSAHWEWETTGKEPYALHEELRLYTDMDPGVGGQYGDAIKLRMNEMTVTDIPGREPVDVAQIVREGRSGMVLSFRDANGEEFSIPIPDGADGAVDGIVTLDPNDMDPNHFVTKADGSKLQLGELARMTINQDRLQELKSSGTIGYGDIATELNGHQDVWTPFAISAAELTENPDGSFNVRSFATIHGEGQLPDIIDVPKTTPGKNTPVIKINGPLNDKLPITELTPPPPEPPAPPMSGLETVTTYTLETPPDEPPPIIPIGFAPRETLEKTIPLVNPEPSGGYNSPITEEQRAILQPRMSSRLRNNPDATLDFQEEARDYFARQNPEYIEEVRRLSTQITTPPSNNLRAMVCIPVAGHQEAGNIYRTLENYTTQDTPLDQFEIILFVNRPDKDKNGNTVSSNETLAEIERFRSNHPDFPVRVIDKVFEGGTTIGNIRKYGTDIAVMRQLEGNPTGGDIAIISNDADNMGVSPTYIRSYLERFDQHPEADGLMGELDWDPEAYAKYPLVLLGTRLFQYIDVQKRYQSRAKGDYDGKQIASSGACFAIRASTYTAVGGYIEDAAVGEDNLLGKAIRVGRQTTEDGTRIQHAGGGSRIYTSARRAVLAVASGKAPSHQWYNYGNDEVDEEVRKFELGGESEINYEDPLVIDKLQKDLEGIIEQTFFNDYRLSTVNSSGGPTNDERIMRRSLSFLGIKADIVGERVQINNIDEIVNNLKLYKEIAVIQRDIKSGKGTDEMRERYVAIVQRIQEEKLRFKAEREESKFDTLESDVSLESPEEGSLITPTAEFTTETTEVDPSDAEDLLNNIEFHGEAYKGKDLTVELIKEKGLIPKYKIQQNGVNIFFSSQAYDLGGGRAAVLAYVEKDGKFIPRSYYRSNSQGVWRFLPAHDGEWFDKGYNEESVTLPFSVQEPLTNLINEHGLASITEPETVFYGTSKQLNGDVSNITYYHEVQKDATKLEGNFYSVGRRKLPPESLTFSDETDSPNFSTKSSSWNGSSEMYGDVTYDVFPSQNGRFLYMFCKDSKNRAWIGGIEELSATTSTGLREQWVAGGDLTTPAYEYPSQASRYGNSGLMNLGYVDMFDNYLSKIPVIQQYLAIK